MVFETLPQWAWVLFGVGVFLFLACGAVISYIIMTRTRWPIIVTVLRDVPPYGHIPIKGDRAREVPFGDAGQTLYFLRKRKKYRVGHGKFIGLNKIAFAIDAAGVWYNCSFGHLDKNKLEVGVMPVDRDMLFANVTVRKGLEKRYDERKFMEKYGTIIAFGMLFLCIVAFGVSSWYTLSKVNSIAASNAEASKTNVDVLKLDEQVTANLANIKSGGAVITSVTPVPPVPSP